MHNEILYKQLRNLPTRKSERYRKWLKAKHPHKEAHHLLGSMTGIKLNDFLLLPITREQHIQAESRKGEFCVENLAKSLDYLFEYIETLENC